MRTTLPRTASAAALLPLVAACVLLLPGPAPACDNGTWPYVNGIQLWDKWTFSFLNLTPVDLKILPSAGDSNHSFGSFPYNTVIPPLNTKTNATSGEDVARTTWHNNYDDSVMNPGKWPSGCQVRVDFQIGNDTTHNFSVYFVQDPNAPAGKPAHSHDVYAQIAAPSQAAASSWPFYKQGTYSNFCARPSVTGGEAVQMVISKDLKYVVTLYKTDKEYNDLNIVVTYLYPDSNYTNWGQCLYWLING